MVFVHFVVPAMLLGLAVMGGAIRAGYAKVDITPHEAIDLAGYDLRGAPSDGIHGHDRLYARCLALDDGTQNILFVEDDVIEIRGTDEFRKAISIATSVPTTNILLGDAHNHAAPCLQRIAKGNGIGSLPTQL